MSKTANSARLAGVSMDELLGYIATVAEVTQQSASTVGTAFKSLFSRFSKIAAGTFVDEETGENLNEISRVLGKLNIELYRTDGSMRSVSDVLKEVSAGWKNYTDVEKNSISTAVAGTRQKEIFLTLMENFPKALEYAGIAFDSAGTAEEKFNAYLEGTEASLNSLKAAFEGFARDTLSAGVIKDLVDFGTILLNLVNNPLTSFILKMTATYAVLKLFSVGVTKLFTSFKIGKLATSNLALGFATLREHGLKAFNAQTLLANGITKVEEAEKAATAATSAFNLALTGVAYLVTVAIAQYQKYKQEQQEIVDRAKTVSKTLGEEASQLRQLIEEYTKLKSQSSMDTETRESIKNIQNQIVDLVGDEAKGLDLVNGNLEEQQEKLKNISSEFAEISWGRASQSYRTLFGEVKDEISDLSEQSFGEGVKGAFLNLWRKITGKQTVEVDLEIAELMPTNVENIDNADKALERLNQKLEDYQKYITQYEKQAKEGIITQEDADKGIEYYQTMSEGVSEAIDKLKEKTNDAKEALRALAQIEVGKKLGEQVISSKEDFEKLKSELVTGKSEFEKDYIIALLTKEFPQYAGEVTTAREKTLGYVDSIENLKSAYETLNGALEDYNTNGSFSYENFEKLMKLQPEYLGYLFDENGQIKDNTAALYDQIAAQLQEQAVTATLAWMDTLKGQTSAEVIKALAGETEAVNDLTAAYASQIKVKALSLGLDADTTNAVIKRATAMANALSKVSYGGGKSSSSSAKKEEDKYAKAISYVTATIDKKIKALQKEKEAIEDVVEAQQEELDQYDKALSYINKYVSARIKELEDEKKALEDKNDETSREIELEELRNNLQKARQRTMRVYYEGQGWIWEQNPEDLRDAQKAMDDFQVENLTKAIEDLIEQWQEYLDLWEKIPDTYDEYSEELAFKQNQDFVTEQDLRNKNLSGLEKFRQAYFQKEKSITETTTDEIDKQIESLNELKDKWSNIKSDIEYEQNAIIAKELLGSSLEADILNGRIKNINTFANEYAAAMNRAASSAESAAGRITNALSIGYVSILSSQQTEQFKKAWTSGEFKGDVELQTKKKLRGMGMTPEQVEFLYENIIKGRYNSTYAELLQGRSTASYMKELGFASGTKKARAGIYNVDELGNELIIDPPSRGRYTVLRDGSGVLPHNLTQRIFDVASNPVNYMLKVLRGIDPNAISSNRGISSNNNTNINISKIELPNVNNVEDFVKELQIISANR